MKQWLLKAAGGLAAAFAAHMGPVPDGIRVLTILLMLLVLVDTIGGVVVAAVRGKLRSHTLRTRFVLKVLMYALASVAAVSTSIVLQTWPIVHGVLGMLCTAEVHSVLEHVHNLEAITGVRMPGLSLLTDKLKPFLAQPDTASDKEVGA